MSKEVPVTLRYLFHRLGPYGMGRYSLAEFRDEAPVVPELSVREQFKG